MKNKILLITSMVMMVVLTCTGCMTQSSYKSSISMDNYSNTTDTAIAQTDIKLMVEQYMSSIDGKNTNKKAIVIMLDGFRANAIDDFYEYGKGIARLAGQGGLYFTRPANIDTDSDIGMSANMLSIMTGVEPGEMGIFKSSDVKREDPASMVSTLGLKYMTSFITDYSNYIDHQLALELKSLEHQKTITATSVETVHQLQDEVLKGIKSKSVILTACSDLYKVAGGDYSIGNVDYMNAVINFNGYIEEIIQAASNRDDDWLIVVASTFGGEESIIQNKQSHNATTFLASNKTIVDGKFI